MKTIKLLILCAVLLTLLTGCDTFKSSYAGPDGVLLGVYGQGTTTVITVSTAHEKFSVPATGGILEWNYDVAEGQPEYVIVQYSAVGQDNQHIRNIKLHLLKSKDLSANDSK